MSEVNPINALKIRGELTPDIRNVSMLENIPVFVYGTLKQDQSNHELLKGETFVGEGEITAYKEYNMRSTYGFPVVYKKKDFNCTTSSYPITGEVYAVSPDALIRLDRLESNGNMYQRKKILVSFKENGVSRSVQCWVYLGLNTCFQRENLYGVTPSYLEGVNKYRWLPNKIQRTRQFNS